MMGRKQSTFTCTHKMVSLCSETSLVKSQCMLKIEGHYEINKIILSG